MIAMVGEESNFLADVTVAGLAKITWQESNRCAAKLYIPAFFVRSSL